MCVTVGVFGSNNSQNGLLSRDKFLAFGTVTRVGNASTFSLGYDWLLEGVHCANTVTFTYNIVAASGTNFRTDIAYVDTANSIKYLAGQENAIAGIPPFLPVGCMLLGTWSVKGNVVGDFQLSTDIFVKITKQDIDDLIANRNLKPGYFYYIEGVDMNLYGGTNIILQAVSTTKLATKGYGQFFNPSYDKSIPGFGMWSNFMYPTMTGAAGKFEIYEIVTADNGATAYYLAFGFLKYISGDWDTAVTISGNSSSATANVAGQQTPFYNVGDIVIWGGRLWRNKSGNVGDDTGSNFELDNHEWELIPFIDDLYLEVYDAIEYDYENDLITFRFEVISGNSVRINKSTLAFNENYLGIAAEDCSSIKHFQWGNVYDIDTSIGNSENTVEFGLISNINFIGNYFTNNYVAKECYISDNLLGIYSFVSNNVFDFRKALSNSRIGKEAYITDNKSCNINNINLGQNAYINGNSDNSITTVNLESGFIAFNKRATIQDIYGTFLQIDNNTFENGGLLSLFDCKNICTIRNNYISGVLTGGDLDNSNIQNVTIQKNAFLLLAPTGTITNKTIFNLLLSSGSLVNIDLSGSTLFMDTAFSKTVARDFAGNMKIMYLDGGLVIKAVNF